MDDGEDQREPLDCLARWDAGAVGCLGPDPDTSTAADVSVTPAADVELDDVELLQLSRDIASSREAALKEKEGSDAVAKRLHYLRQLAAALDQIGAVTASKSFKWSSHLTRTRGKCECKLDTGSEELLMALCHHGMLLRKEALRSLDVSGTTSAEGEGDADADAGHDQKAVALLREASGSLRLIAELQEESAKGKFQMQLPKDLGGRPSEVCAPMGVALHYVCLGEAQLVSAHRAEARGVSSSLLSSLYHGASVYFEAATRNLKGNVAFFDELSEALMKYLALISWLSLGRGFEHGAAALPEDEAGMRVAALRRAHAYAERSSGLLGGAGDWAGPNEAPWRRCVAAELARLAKACAKADKENQIVWFQSVPSAEDANTVLGAPRQIVKHVPLALADPAPDGAIGST